MKVFLNIMIFVPIIGFIIGTYLLFVKKYRELHIDCIGFAAIFQGTLIGNIMYELLFKM